MAALPDPRPGLVIHYNYLWRREQAAGQDNARKSRPCAVVLSARMGADGQLVVAVAPITRQPPGADVAAIEIPTAVKRHLGLDDARSWIIADELNEFEWPGFDLQPNARGDFVYGFLPPRLYEQLRLMLLARVQAGQLGRTPR